MPLSNADKAWLNTQFSQVDNAIVNLRAFVTTQFNQVDDTNQILLLGIDTIKNQCDLIISMLQNQRSGVQFAFGIGQATNKTGEEIPKMDISITNEQKVNVTLHPVTATGKPASIDGVPTWEIISGNSTVEPAADGLSAFLVSADDPGDTEVLVKADADLGEGVIEISDVIRLSVAGAQAASLGLSADEPVAK
jgi:hypothetical protein